MTLNQNPDLEIVILCNKNDYFLTKICVSSIRYYYPGIPLSIVKDELNGRFSTSELEEKFNVKALDLGLKNYGYCTGKIAVLLAESLKGKKILLLDSDIVFIGKVLDKFIPLLNDTDFIVTPQYPASYESDWFKKIYYKMEWASKAFPNLVYPGYAFNGGSMLVTPGKISESEMINFIDLSKYPYWTQLTKENLPCRDQSLLNILLPIKEQKGDIVVKPVFFQIWSETKLTAKHEMKYLDLPLLEKEGCLSIVQNFDLDIIKKDGYPFLVHWAGAVRIPYIEAMSHAHVLSFFELQYYKKLRFGLIRYFLYARYHKLKFYWGRLGKKLKKNSSFQRVIKMVKIKGFATS